MLLQEGASVPGQTLGGPGPGVLGPTSTHHPTLKLEEALRGQLKVWGEPGAGLGPAVGYREGSGGHWGSRAVPGV